MRLRRGIVQSASCWSLAGIDGLQRPYCTAGHGADAATVKLTSILVFAVLAVVCSGCAGQRAAPFEPEAQSQAVSATTLAAVVVGQWTWSNTREGFILDVKIPERLRTGYHAQTVTFTPDGRARFARKYNVPPESPFEGSVGGTWRFDERDPSCVILAFDPDPQGLSLRFGVSGELHIYFHVQQLAGVSFLVQTVDTGYLTYVKPSP